MINGAVTYGAAGAWWVLKQPGTPLVWTGEFVEYPIDNVPVPMPVFSNDRRLARQFAALADAVFVVEMFGLGGQVCAERQELA